MKLSIDFAFAGIEIIKKNPLAVLVWGLVYLVVSVVSSVLMVAVAGPALMALQNYQSAPDADPMAVFGHLSALVPVYIVAGVLGLIASAIVQCAVFRSQLQPEAGGLASLKLGGDEFRQILVGILWALAFVLFYIVFGIALAILIGIISMVGQFSEILAGILIFVLVVGSIVTFLYIVSRWSLVMVQSFAEKKINIFGSFKLTQGQGWKLLGGYLLLGLVMIVIMIIVYSLVFALVVGTSGGWMQAITQMSRPDMSSVAALMTPVFFAQTIVSSLLMGGFYALIYGASAAAYSALSDKGTRSVEVF